MTIDASALRTLHRLHRQLSDLRARLASGPRQVKAGEMNNVRLEELLKTARDVARRTRMTLDDKELQLKQREGRIQDVKLRLNSCSSNKEYQAYLEQIAADEQANSVLSDEIIELLDRSHADQEAVREAEKKLATGTRELEELKKRVTGQRDDLESELARVDKLLREAEDALPGDIRQDYNRVVKAHGEDALAEVESDCCGGCFRQITAQMFNELKMSRIVFCKSCGRLLYLPEEPGAP